MKEELITINMESMKYNLIVEAKDIYEIIFISPFCANLSTVVAQNGNKILIELNDQITSHFFGDKKKVICLYSPNVFSKTIRIIVPSESSINLNINLENGSILLKNIVFDKTHLSSIRGNIGLENCYGEDILIEGYQSNVSLINTAGVNCTTHIKTGNVLIEDNVPSNTEIKTEIGNINLKASEFFLINTGVTLTSKYLKNQNVPARKEKTRTLVLEAPYGNINSNIF